MTPVPLIVRLATPADVEPMHRIRLSVGENKLGDPARVSTQSYAPYLAAGSGWVAEISGAILGFAIIDAADRSVWALFVDSGAEGKGIGRALHGQMMTWSRKQRLQRLSLTTAPGTRAAQFYRDLGWSELGRAENGDVRFERDV